MHTKWMSSDITTICDIVMWAKRWQKIYENYNKNNESNGCDIDNHVSNLVGAKIMPWNVYGSIKSWRDANG